MMNMGAPQMPQPQPQQSQGINTGMDPMLLERLMQLQQPAQPPMDPKYQSNFLRPEPTQQLPMGRQMPLPVNSMQPPMQQSPMREMYPRPLR